MKIITHAKYEWNGTSYDKVSEESFNYEGEISYCCGASSGQQALGASQSAYYATLQQQAQQVFGESSAVFKNLMGTFQPIVAQGPNQAGFSPGELSNFNSQAITNVGNQYRNAAAATGNQIASQGGGNSSLPSGAAIGVQENLASQAANETSSELSQINQQNYAVGRQNYQNAVQGEEAAPGVFGAATGAAGAANQGGSAAGETWNNISQQQQSWMGPVFGALGAVGGAATKL